jgi:proteasome assembly chaperone (PAC2) family protein
MVAGSNPARGASFSFYFSCLDLIPTSSLAIVGAAVCLAFFGEVNQAHSTGCVVGQSPNRRISDETFRLVLAELISMSDMQADSAQLTLDPANQHPQSQRR